MASYLITGTSRGIGLEMVKQLATAASVKTVVAVTRNKDSNALNDIVSQSQGKVVNVIIPDITDEQAIQKSVPEIEKALGGGALDVLINNAGASDWHAEGLPKTAGADLTKLFVTNVASVQAVTATLFPLLEKGSTKKIMNISTTVGSIAHATTYAAHPAYGYKVSKAALNMLTRLWSLEFAKAGFTVMAITPGWLKTDLGSEHADLPVEVGVEQVLKIVDGASSENNGEFRNIKVAGWEKAKGMNQYDGAVVAW